MTRCVEYTELESRCFIPGELFTVDISIIADPGETPYAASDDYTMRFDWFDADDETYTKEGTPAIAAVALTPPAAPDGGVRLTLVVPSTVTALWPVTGYRGVCRVQRGAGASTETLAAFDMKLSDFAKNLG